METMLPISAPSMICPPNQSNRSFAHRLLETREFLLGVELVSTRGILSGARAAKTLAFARELAGLPGIDWVSITDNAGGNPMLAPPALGRPFLDAGRDVVIHLSCKDFNRNGLESEAWHLASEGFHNVLALSGDASGAGIGGGAKPVFDIDSVGLLSMLSAMNQGLKVAPPGAGGPQRLDPTEFFAGAVVTNFKLLENEIVPQLLKAEVKIAAGARYLINQIGYDSRKMHELLVWLRLRGHGRVPLIGNVYLLNGRVARFFRKNTIPGVVLSDALAELCERKAAGPDKGRNFFLELAAKQVAIYRGMGYRGAYLGGVHSATEIDRILRIADGFAPCDWKEFTKEFRFSRPGEYFLFAEDPQSGLADASSPSAPGLPKPENLGFNYRVSKMVHSLMFTPGKGLWKAGAALCARSADSRQGPGWLRAMEHAGKSLMFGCRDCGDCSLPDIAFLCPESACAKNQRNGPCGGTRDGKCEVAEFECIWSRAYDRLKHEGRANELLAHAPVIQNQQLRGTSSWANTWLGRDHLANPLEPASQDRETNPHRTTTPPPPTRTQTMTTKTPASLQAKLENHPSPVAMLRASPVGGYQFPDKPEYSNWRDEQAAWQNSVVLFDQSFHMKDVYFEGPDVLKLVSDVAVNTLSNFGPNKAKQIVACNHDGHVIGDAILFGHSPEKVSVVGRPSVPNWVEYNAVKGGYNVRVTRDERSVANSGRRLIYRYQIQGPNALELLKSVHEGEFPEIKFFNLGDLKIAGRRVRALNHNMSRMGGLELHGPAEDGEAILEAILKAGPKFGLLQGGARSYSTVSPESGWIPSPMPAIWTDQLRSYREWLPGDGFEANASLGGSFDSPEISDYYQTPWDLGYGRHVKFDHDFIGSDALKRLESGPHRRKVWLRWNTEDSLRIFGSQFDGGPRYKYMEMPNAYYAILPFDKVSHDGKPVGLSTYTVYTVNVRSWFSLAMIDETIPDGAEVELLWGEPGGGSNRPIVERHEQTSVRCTVSYNRLNAE